MPSTVSAVFAAAGIESEGCVPWGTELPERAPGVYVIGLVKETEDLSGALGTCPASHEAVGRLLDARPELTLDGVRPAAEELVARIASFWLPDEVILYIGLAGSSLATRVRQYYSTPLGARSPHAGGWFLKTLRNLGNLYVHYAACRDPSDAEDKMLGSFCAAVSERSLAILRDQDHPFPFANLEFPRGVRKQHGISGAKEPRWKRSKRAAPKARGGSVPAQRTRRTAADAAKSDRRTQRVTAADLRAGHIRIPRGSKDLFPSERCELDLTIRGRSLRCRYDPRFGPPERSGVLGVGKNVLPALVQEDDVLQIDRDDGHLSVR